MKKEIDYNLLDEQNALECLEHIKSLKVQKPNFYVDKEIIINDNNNHSEMGLPLLYTVDVIIGTLL